VRVRVRVRARARVRVRVRVRVSAALSTPVIGPHASGSGVYSDIRYRPCAPAVTWGATVPVRAVRPGWHA
jgi:hypothetical protein